MPRRALLATMITAAIGALMGVIFGAIVGRVIALFGDETVQTSVPMIFCATLGYFVGGASTIKGSLERFGAPRAPVGTFLATVVLVLLVGGVSIGGRSSGVIVILTALVALVLASVVAVAVGKPSDTPKHGLNSPREGAPPRAVKQPKVKKSKAEPESVVEPEPEPEPVRPTVREAARRVSTEPPPQPRPLVTPIDQLDDEELADWMPESEPEPEPEPAPPARPRRDRPLSRADVPAAPVKKGPVTKKAAPPKKAAAPAKKSAPPPKKAAPAIKKAPAPRKKQ